jgi:hypothetical protein
MIRALGICLSLSLLNSPTGAKADCICVQPKDNETMCFTVKPGPSCPGGTDVGGGGSGGNFEVVPYKPIWGGGGAGGNHIEADPEQLLEDFRGKMQELQTPILSGRMN